MGLKELQKIREDRGKPKEKKIYHIPKVSAKKAAQMATEKTDRGGEDTELQKWYARIMKNEISICWETGEKINKQDKVGWHGSIAHCLPKSLFPSVATHPDNYMILSMWNGSHATYDSSWEAASKMKVWTLACKTFNILYPLLTREEKSKLPDIIIQEIKPEIYNPKTKY